MITNAVRNFGAIVVDRTCLTGISPTGQADDTTMGDYEDYENTYADPAPAPAPLAPAQAPRHRERERDRDRENREREEPRRSDKHRRR